MKAVIFPIIATMILAGCVLPPSRAEVYQKEMQQRDAAERERRAVEYRAKQEKEEKEKEENERKVNEHKQRMLAKVKCKTAYLLGPAKAALDRWDFDFNKETKELVALVMKSPFHCRKPYGDTVRWDTCSGYVIKPGLKVDVYGAMAEEDLILILANLPLESGVEQVLLKTKPEYLACP